MKTEIINATFFEPGDIVRMPAGGPDMTVLGNGDDEDHVDCGWFNNVDGSWFFEAIQIPVEALRPVAVN